MLILRILSDLRLELTDSVVVSRIYIIKVLLRGKVNIFYILAERKQSLGYDWHPECLRCEECGKRLNPGQHAEVVKFLCKNHQDEYFDNAFLYDLVYYIKLFILLSIILKKFTLKTQLSYIFLF